MAILISFVALWLTFQTRGEKESDGRRKALCALTMGAAIPVMHYTGMASASFVFSPTAKGDLAHALSISSLGTASIIVATFMVLGLAVVTDQRSSLPSTP